MIRFFVAGVPAPKGSSRAILRGGRAINVPSGTDANKERLKSWRAEASGAAQLAMDGSSPLAGPVYVEIEFIFERLRAHFGTGKNAAKVKSSAPHWQTSKPDADKIERSTFDALTGIIYVDDAQIAQHKTTKRYAAPGEAVGAWIAISPLPGDPRIVPTLAERVLMGEPDIGLLETLDFGEGG